jgi:hypothetical protein
MVYFSFIVAVVEFTYRFIDMELINYQVEVIRRYFIYQGYIRLTEILYLDLMISMMLSFHNTQAGLANLVAAILLLLANLVLVFAIT